MTDYHRRENEFCCSSLYLFTHSSNLKTIERIGNIEQRKKDHIEYSVSGQAAYHKTAGFERYDFIHNALPETDFDEISTEAEILGYQAGFPLFISSMTGGYTEAGQVNRIIAGFCQQYRIPFGVGSQRIMLENPEAAESFSVVRKEAPNAFIASNIGGCQLIGDISGKTIKLLVDSIDADAVIVHLNPLQELMQPEGDRNFKGVLHGIEHLVKQTQLPVIVKETGAGINGNTARKLLDCGVRVIDVSGAGGTSWSKIENFRRGVSGNALDEWGLPTVDCLLDLKDQKIPREQIIASGGIKSASDISKALCLGAGIAAMAQPVIQMIDEGGHESLEAWYKQLDHQFKVMMCLLGCRHIDELGPHHLRKV